MPPKNPLRVGLVALPATAPRFDVLRTMPGITLSCMARPDALDEIRSLASYSDVMLLDVADGQRALELVDAACGLPRTTLAGLCLVEFGGLPPDALRASADAFAAGGASLHGAAWGLPPRHGEQALRLYADDDALDNAACATLLQALAPSVFRAGPAGASKALAIVEGLLLSVITLASAEALALGNAMQLAPELLLPLLTRGSGANELLRDPSVPPEGRGVPPGALDDALRRADALADQVRHPLPFGTLSRSVLRCTTGTSRDAYAAAYAWFARQGANAR